VHVFKYEVPLIFTVNTVLFYTPILFTICTVHSANCAKMYSMACRRGLGRVLL
jgi:hypothetical protein